MTRIAAIQMASGPIPDANLYEAERLIRNAAAAGAQLIVLPENFAVMPIKEEDRAPFVERDGDGSLQNFLASQARQHRVWLVGGTIPLAAQNKNKIRSACLVYNDRGERVARYDKIHLFDVKFDNGEQYHESHSFEAGDETVVVDTPFGRVGLAICYDLRFPELFRRLLDQGAELFAVPSAFTAHTGKAHWEILVRARAIENLSYVIASGQGGYHVNGRETHGDSMIVSPWGEVLDRLHRGSGFAVADCDQEQLQRVRTNLPSIQHRRLRCAGRTSVTGAPSGEANTARKDAGRNHA